MSLLKELWIKWDPQETWVEVLRWTVVETIACMAIIAFVEFWL